MPVDRASVAMRVPTSQSYSFKKVGTGALSSVLGPPMLINSSLEEWDFVFERRKYQCFPVKL